MAVVLKTLPVTILCVEQLLTDINADVAISAVLQVVTIDDGVNATLTFDVALSTSEDTALDLIISGWDNSTCPVITPVTVLTAGTLLNVSHQMVFGEYGDASNKWLELYGDSRFSNQTLGVMPFKSKLIGITFSNRYSSRSTDIKIYSTPEGGGYTPKTLDLTWSISSKRTARKTIFATDIIFDAGDKIGVYAADTGSNPYDVAVILYFVVIDEITSEGGESWSGNYGTGTGGGSS